jgi:hypothetical protein
MALTKPAELSYDDTNKPPIALLSLASQCISSGQPITLKRVSGLIVPSLIFHTGEEITGIQLIGRYLCRLLELRGFHYYGMNPIESTQIDFFIDLSHALMEKDTLEFYCDHLNTHLQYRTYLVGEIVSIADLLVWQQLTYNPRFHSFKGALENQYIDLYRWYQHISTLSIFIHQIQEYHRLQAEKQEKWKKNAQQGSFNIELKGRLIIYTLC